MLPVMILAAGRGERMRPLTDHTPKPLLAVGGRSLIEWHLHRLHAAGLTELVINHAHLGGQLLAALGDGSRLGVRIRWSAEPPGALETAGGIVQAHPWSDPEHAFMVVNGDIWYDIDFAGLAERAAHLPADTLAHLVLVPNPPQHPDGDFALHQGRVSESGPRVTFSGIGLYRPALFDGLRAGNAAKLAPLLRQAMAQGRVSGEMHLGLWFDVGTPQRLAQVDALLTERAQREAAAKG